MEPLHGKCYTPAASTQQSGKQIFGASETEMVGNRHPLFKNSTHLSGHSFSSTSQKQSKCNGMSLVQHLEGNKDWAVKVEM